MPIIVVSSRSDVADKIEALDAGADDYLTKPFSWTSCSRVFACAPRVQFMQEHNGSNESIFENGDLKIDLRGLCLHRRGGNPSFSHRV
jgi:two-component system KDP operon response regulator KdpE